MILSKKKKRFNLEFSLKSHMAGKKKELENVSYLKV